MITTARLRLEFVSAQHAADIVAYRVRNRAYLEPWEAEHPAEHFTLQHVEAGVSRAIADPDQKRLIIYELDGHGMIGQFDLTNIRRGIVQAATIGYSIDAAHAGRGFASEAAGAVIDYAFGKLALHRLEASYLPDNEASGRVLVKNGFRVEGYAREYLFLRGSWCDVILVARTNRTFTLQNG